MEDLQTAIEQLQAEGFWVIGPDLADEGDTIRLLDNSDYTVVARKPKGFVRDPEQSTIYGADPVTGEMLPGVVLFPQVNALMKRLPEMTRGAFSNLQSRATLWSSLKGLR